MDEWTEQMHERENNERLLDAANNNSYLLVTGRKTLNQILERRGDQSFVCMPDETPTNKDLQLMIDYFITTEEYEKCAELRDALIANEIESMARESS